MFQEDTIENPLSMKIVDMPACVRFNSETALNLLEVLATTENIEIFENKSLRAIIEYKFPVIRKAIVSEDVQALHFDVSLVHDILNLVL